MVPQQMVLYFIGQPCAQAGSRVQGLAHGVPLGDACVLDPTAVIARTSDFTGAAYEAGRVIGLI